MGFDHRLQEDSVIGSVNLSCPFVEQKYIWEAYKRDVLGVALCYTLWTAQFLFGLKIMNLE